jgi:hypothetical protein
MDHVLCPHCGQAIHADSQLADRAFACPSCRGQFTVFAAEPVPPPVVVSPLPLPPPTPRRRPPPKDNTVLIIAGVAVAIVLLLGIGIAVYTAITRTRDSSGASVADSRPGSGRRPAGGNRSQSLDPSRPLPPLDQLIGRPFPADHPDAEARIAEAGSRKTSVIQSGNEVRIGDVHVSDNPIGEYGGFAFGINQDREGQPIVTTSSGEEPLRIPRSFGADKGIVERFLKQHHGAANVRIEQLAEDPYYLADLAADPPTTQRIIHDGRSREEIQKHIDKLSEVQPLKLSIGKLQRIGTVVRAVYRLQGRGSGMRSEEEFLVLNGKVVYRFGSSRSASLGNE